MFDKVQFVCLSLCTYLLHQVSLLNRCATLNTLYVYLNNKYDIHIFLYSIYSHYKIIQGKCGGGGMFFEKFEKMSPQRW